MATVEELRAEAKAILEVDRAAWQIRSCHRCNAAHDYLTNQPPDGPLICCFDCGRWYFKGVDITYEV